MRVRSRCSSPRLERGPPERERYSSTPQTSGAPSRSRPTFRECTACSFPLQRLLSIPGPRRSASSLQRLERPAGEILLLGLSRLGHFIPGELPRQFPIPEQHREERLLEDVAPPG